MKKLLLTLAVMMLIGCGEPDTEWTGYLMYGYDTPNEPVTHVQTNIQIGLRDDGVIVYRKIKEEETKK